MGPVKIGLCKPSGQDGRGAGYRVSRRRRRKIGRSWRRRRREKSRWKKGEEDLMEEIEQNKENGVRVVKEHEGEREG